MRVWQFTSMCMCRICSVIHISRPNVPWHTCTPCRDWFWRLDRHHVQHLRMSCTDIQLLDVCLQHSPSTSGSNVEATATAQQKLSARMLPGPPASAWKDQSVCVRVHGSGIASRCHRTSTLGLQVSRVQGSSSWLMAYSTSCTCKWNCPRHIKAGPAHGRTQVH